MDIPTVIEYITKFTITTPVWRLIKIFPDNRKEHHALDYYALFVYVVRHFIKYRH